MLLDDQLVLAVVAMAGAVLLPLLSMCLGNLVRFRIRHQRLLVRSETGERCGRRLFVRVPLARICVCRRRGVLRIGIAGLSVASMVLVSLAV